MGPLDLHLQLSLAAATLLGSCLSVFLTTQRSCRYMKKMIGLSILHFSLVKCNAGNILQVFYYLLVLSRPLFFLHKNSFQKALDNAFRSSIKVSLASLREQARFSAVAYPHAGAWLRAIPNSSLGLAMSPREFVTFAFAFGNSGFSSTPTLSQLCVRS